jgi:hypothetical protein
MSTNIKNILASLAMCSLLTASTSAAEIYSNGFETDVLGWNAATTRVPSGTAGVPSATGSFHAQDNDASATSNPFTGWGATATPSGGYNFGAGPGVGVPFQEYTTSVDVYLDVDAPLANNTRLDFSSAINNSSGNHRRDFIFNMGFYNDATGPGAGTDRFVVSASTNSQPGSAFAKNPANGPIAISTTGWYTFEHHFYDNGLGILAVDMSIYDATSALVNSWTRSDVTDVIDVTVGGNRYGWFDFNELPVLAFDNARLTVVPEPTSIVLLGLATGSFFVVRRRRRA